MENQQLQLAEQYALQTRHHIFLTGKAGTGKTTLLKKISQKTSKNYVIVAPTGVAAINAGGVTIHSMFNLPLTSFIPSSDYVESNVVMNRRLLAGHMKFRREKLRVIRELDLLIIDEASMVRSDILDAIDFVLRSVRKNQQPFGGVQVMLIGDMHQLPPVVKNDEWNVLQNYYQGPYFFDAHVWKQLNAVEIELQTIYRQKDEKFLDILNNIRHQRLEQNDLEELKKRYDPLFKPEPGYILLSTHNRRADSVNDQELRKLPGKMHSFEAEVDGDFPDHMFPCVKTLLLKEGAQVMFIKNDAEGGLYYNGKLAVVKKIDGDKITVTFSDTKTDFLLKKETWENISYSMEDGSEKISKKELGSFSQYPLRLAWAVTIHKSQGLTFDKVIIDAGQSFAAGQVYVALSRCRTLEGIVLHSMIHQNALFSDERISEFTDGHHAAQELQEILLSAKNDYANFLLRRLFNFDKLRTHVAEWKELVLEKDLPQKDKVLELVEQVHAELEHIISTAQKFQPQLDRLLIEYSRDKQSIIMLKERCEKGIIYFTENIFTKIIQPLHAHINDFAFKARVKKYLRHAQALEDIFWLKMNGLYDAIFIDEKLFTAEKKYQKEQLEQAKASATTAAAAKKEKGATYLDTLELYRQGKTIEEIAAIRSLVAGTIKGHFAKWIEKGEIDILKVMPAEKVQRLEKALEMHGENFPALRETLGDDFDFGDLRMVGGYMARQKVV